MAPSVSVAVLMVSLVLITLIAALPCILFFWLAQRFTWRRLWIYLVSGALAAQLAQVLLGGVESVGIDATRAQRLLLGFFGLGQADGLALVCQLVDAGDLFFGHRSFPPFVV